MTIIRVGATKKYSDGWETAFGKGKKKAAPVAAAKKSKTASKKAAVKKKATASAKKRAKPKGKK